MIYGPKITRLKVQTKSKLEQRSSVDNIQLGIYQRNKINMKSKQHNWIEHSTKNNIQNTAINKLLKLIREDHSGELMRKLSKEYQKTGWENYHCLQKIRKEEIGGQRKPRVLITYLQTRVQ